MKDTPVPYKKLRTRSYGLDGICRLFAGPDHLLQVNSWMMSERYRRFYLRDIEAIVLRPTLTRVWWNVTWGVLAAGAFGFAALFWWLATMDDGPDEVVGLVFAGLAAAAGLLAVVMFAINTFFGETCSCHVQTAAGLERIVAISRRRAANRVLAELAPLIKQAQTSPPLAGAPAPAPTP